MTKILSQSFILFMAVAIGSILFSGMEAKANDLASTNVFFEQGLCEFLDGREKRLCLLHCELLECDEAENLNLGPIFSVFHERACNRLLNRYEALTGLAGPPCFCSQTCDLQQALCEEGCIGAEDESCCMLQCRNAGNLCRDGCCNEREGLLREQCISDCIEAGGEECEFQCPFRLCRTVLIGCLPPVPE